MAISHGTYSFLGTIFMMGSMVMLFFIVLSGVRDGVPLNNTFFLRADTNGINGARPVSQWTFFAVCGDSNSNCNKASAAYAFGSAWLSPPTGAPFEFVGDQDNGTTSSYYYYMWRVCWALYMMTIVIETIAFFCALVQTARRGTIFAGILSVTALFFYTIAAGIMTGIFVKAKDIFLANGRNASIGMYAFGFTWGAWVSLLIATILFYMGYLVSRPFRNTGSGRHRRHSSFEFGGRRVKDTY